MGILLSDIEINQEAQNRDYTNPFWWLQFGRDIAKLQLKEVSHFVQSDPLFRHFEHYGEFVVMLNKEAGL